MSDACDVPTDLELLTEWMRAHFDHWRVGERTRADLNDIFDNIDHRGNAREAWFDTLWIKVQQLRKRGATWTVATHTALETWKADDPILPPTWHDAAYRARHEDKVSNLVQQLKNRIEDVSDLGIDKVTDTHFWIALVAGRHVIAARLYRAAKPQLRKQISKQLIRMASPHTR